MVNIVETNHRRIMHTPPKDNKKKSLVSTFLCGSELRCHKIRIFELTIVMSMTEAAAVYTEIA